MPTRIGSFATKNGSNHPFHNNSTDFIVNNEVCENCSFGECYSFLCVSKYLEDFPRTVVRKSKNGVVMVHAWVENITRPGWSEFGTIGERIKHDGFLVRVM